MINRTFLIVGLGLIESQRAIENVLGIAFERRETSYNASDYYRCVIDDQHRLKLSENEDFGGAPIYEKFSTKDVLLQVGCPVEDDELFTQVSGLEFARPIDPGDLI